MVRTTRRDRTVDIRAGDQIITVADPLPEDLREALTKIHESGADQFEPSQGRTATTDRAMFLVVRNLEPPLDSVHRALVLLKALRDGETLSVKGAAERLDVVPSTAHRLLNALCYDGFAMQTRDRDYRLGPDFHPDQGRSISLDAFRTVVRPVIENLSQRFGETVHVWVRQGPLLRWVDGVEGAAPAHVSPDKWDRVPAYASAAGKALLSELTNRQVEEIFSGGLPPARSSRITNLHTLKRHLASVHSRGYAISIEEAAQGVDGVAVCAKDSWGRPVFAISLAIPSSRFDRGTIPRYVEALHDAVERSEELLIASSEESSQGAPALTRRASGR